MHLTWKVEIRTQCVCLYMLYANQVWGRPATWTKFYRPKVGKKWTILNRYISVITNIDEKWFVVSEHTINWLSFGYIHLPQLEYYFSSFFSFFLLFFFWFFSGYLLLNCWTHSIQSLSDWKYQGGLVPDWNRGCQVGGIPLKWVLQNFELLNRWS